MLAKVFDEYTGLIIGIILFLIAAGACIGLQDANESNITVYKNAFAAQFNTD